jgi:antirestriction protein ArdC
MKKDILINEVSTTVLNILEEHKAKGTMPQWNKGFIGGFQPLRENGQAYKGFNAFYLGLIVGIKGYTSPYFFTFNKLLEIMGYKKKDLNSKGFAIREGDKVARVGFCKLDRIDLAKKIEGKGTPIIYYETLNIKGDEFVDEEGNKWQAEGKIIPMMKNYTVFNACQVEGLPEKYFPKAEELAPTNQRIDEIDRFFDAQQSELKTSTNGAFYRPSEDAVYMPEWSRWNTSNEYYSVLSHEYIHSTGTKERCNRAINNKFGSTKYAFEELVAELGSLFCMMEFGLQHQPTDNNIAYLDNWIALLKDHKESIFKATALASKGAEFLQQQAQSKGVILDVA